MTGKDFSGPTPIIKAPTPPQIDGPMGDVVHDGGDAPSAANVRKKSRTPGVSEGDEIIGSIDDE